MPIGFPYPTLAKTKALRVVFSGEISAYEVPYFRGAMGRKVGLERVLFHHHNPDNTFRNAYPLIQYKRIKRNPAILCLGEGVDEIHHYFQQPDWSISIKGRPLEMKIKEMDLKQYNLQVWDRWFEYRIDNWVALNQGNFAHWKQLPDQMAQREKLQQVLKGNILSMATGLEWYADREIQVEIAAVPSPKTFRIKGIAFQTFTVWFRTNVFLPPYIGLGGKTSMGYGMVHRPRVG